MDTLNMPDIVVAPQPEESRINSFWQEVALPHQTEDRNFEFTNSVTTAEWFAEGTKTIAHLAGLAEVLEEEIANFQVHLRRKEHELAKLKRDLLAQNYSGITKSAGADIQDAYVWKLVTESNRTEQFDALESEIEELQRLIEVRKPRRDQLYARLKSLKDSHESARQYLDYAKLERRLQAAQNGIKL